MISVRVLLFGMLREGANECEITLQLQEPFCVEDVIARLDRHSGAGLLSMVDVSAERNTRNWLIFLNGDLVADANAPVYCGDGAAQLELIVLNALEGG